MEPVVYTPRLKLTLVTKAERGSPEYEWLHILWSDEKASFWSFNGRSKSTEETEKLIASTFPTPQAGEEKSYRVVYAVHALLEPWTPGDGTSQPRDQLSELIGMVSLRSLNVGFVLPMPEELMIPAAEAATTLLAEISYMYLPGAWGKGYATESVRAALAAYGRAKSFWAPWERVYVRAIVNGRNRPSARVLDKIMTHKGTWEWTAPGKPLFIGGEWREQDFLEIYGMHVLE
ncbi:hypothetical protein B0T26DRAFT_715119 [Lasiosphaeria miniovina]|uniref:N-acetyltransferase domain-containing protein n=1 Tax=Lasiosphaeria miniovina TaxID=1954250 RepID=A0AA40ABE8_9PEZI|nr:uncharacterized protein B0T26DRAFT_715119 [Lasiosphaeria miniovina]KAK0712742.1 hypothetical protein B0T26DRAFT_715119 [Lasiosphaeria miniovina]